MVSENKIKEAIRAGEFENLEGFGKPLPLDSEPYDPHWWIRRKMKREQIVLEANARQRSTDQTEPDN